MGRTALRHNRRRLLRGGLALAGFGLLAGCGGRVPWARPTKLPSVGVLLGGSALPSTARFRDSFLGGLASLGYIEGQTIALELRYGEPGTDRFDQASELVSLPVDVIVLAGDVSMAAARQATGTVPIVFALNSAPVEAGVVASLSRPGGNVTGLSEITPELSGKRVELLREAVPGLARAGVVWSPQFPGPALQFQEAEQAARALGLELVPLPVRSTDEIDVVPAATTLGRAQGLAVLTGAIVNPNAERVVETVAGTRLPANYGERLFVDAGGLMSYGADVADMWRRAAYVDKILKCARPADLPVERPDRFDFVVNLVTARALGLTILPAVLAQATELVQQ